MADGNLPRIGTAGWSIGSQQRGNFPSNGSALQRYSSVFSCVEVNSSFYRPHKPQTYARWAASVPASFRFAVKVPKTISHDAQLIDCGKLLDEFLEGPRLLGDRLGPLLVQLPPKLVFNADIAAAFFEALRIRHSGLIVCEPRHASWFSPEASTLLATYRIARVAADPSMIPEAAVPTVAGGIAYWRFHGSPRVYYSEYSVDRLAALAADAATVSTNEFWYIFDNTASGAALGNALQFRDLTSPGALD